MLLRGIIIKLRRRGARNVTHQEMLPVGLGWRCPHGRSCRYPHCGHSSGGHLGSALSWGPPNKA